MHRLLVLPLALAFATPAYAIDFYCSISSDWDGDGHAAIRCGGDDCDDDDANRYPGNVEVCDSDFHDEDCNLDTPGSVDRDRDGFDDDSCKNVDDTGAVVSSGNDCDDANRSVNPITAEVCNAIDDNCDGQIDEQLTREYWTDDDGDGFGAKSLGQLCPHESEEAAERGGDCDDASASIFPGMQVCSGETGVDVCTVDGTWSPAACGLSQVCVDQPNELGVCMLSGKKAKKKGDDDDSSDD